MHHMGRMVGLTDKQSEAPAPDISRIYLRIRVPRFCLARRIYRIKYGDIVSAQFQASFLFDKHTLKRALIAV